MNQLPTFLNPFAPQPAPVPITPENYRQARSARKRLRELVANLDRLHERCPSLLLPQYLHWMHRQFEKLQTQLVDFEASHPELTEEC